MARVLCPDGCGKRFDKRGLASHLKNSTKHGGPGAPMAQVAARNAPPPAAEIDVEQSAQLDGDSPAETPESETEIVASESAGDSPENVSEVQSAPAAQTIDRRAAIQNIITTAVERIAEEIESLPNVAAAQQTFSHAPEPCHDPDCRFCGPIYTRVHQNLLHSLQHAVKLAGPEAERAADVVDAAYERYIEAGAPIVQDVPAGSDFLTR